MRKNIKEATQKWIEEFNAIPQVLITKAYPELFDELNFLVTEKECYECGSTSFTESKEGFICENCESSDSGNSHNLPMWGTMWTFGSSLDEEWALNNLEKMEKCGIWVYESDELGVFFGINGAGYDFYENHWIPLYKERGLKWHV